MLPRDRGPDEADLSAIAAPDGTSVFFCRTDARADSWIADFVTAGDAGAGTELTGIDHVALSQPFDYFDEAALFYRSVLGLELEDRRRARRARRARPQPRRAQRRRPRALRAQRAGRRPRRPALQHVAFACDDVFTCARAMRERGVPLLEIPGNYYDDLAARTELDEEAIERMRELGVLYDASDGGELLHFYTAMAGSVFFEVLERRGGYEGYGAANSPVRMAAQRGG